MNNKVNYRFIGFSVLFGFFLIFGFTYWLLKPSSEDEVRKYRIYFNESVAGLNLNAPVKYRGIRVGKVVDLRINPLNIEEVQATVTILKSTPIKETTVAKLTAQGITGLTYINLSLGDNRAPLLVAKEGEKYPVIKSVPSLFKNVEKSLGELSGQLSEVLEKTNKFLDEENRRETQRVLLHTANILEHIDGVLDAKTVAHLHSSVANLDKFSFQLTQLVPKVDYFLSNSVLWEDKMSNSFGSIQNTYIHMGGIMEDMATAFANVEGDIQDVSLTLVPRVNETLLEMQNSMIEFDTVMREYRRSPSDMLFKKREERRGPGEK